MKLTRVAALGALVALTLPLAGCGGDEEKSTGDDPRTVLAEAKERFDSASSVHFTMATKSEPKGDAVLGANGTLTHQPAFEGEVKAHYLGFDVDIPVVSVDGKVYAKLPLKSSYDVIDPSEFNAPDPADFADPGKGISGLLLELEGTEESGEVREGKEVLTTYSGTLTGDLVAPIIPSAAESSDYETVIGIDSDGRIATLKVTGDFFSGSGDVTYKLVFDDYGKKVEISKP